jgi:hypothetical protein
MQGTVILRSLCVLALAAAVSGCHPSTRSTAGQTPLPSQTTMAQANSTAPPEQALSSGPAEKYIATTGPNLKDVTFELWANGRPIGTIKWPSKSLDITKDMRGHANVLVIKWDRTAKNGTGTLAIHSQSGKKVLSANVTPSSKATGQVSKTMIAPQAPVGRSGAGSTAGTP